jgi:hypothetical protein
MERGMRFRVQSGDYQTVIDRPSAKQAAVDAIGLWVYKTNKPQLATLTTVVAGKKVIYLSTLVLIEENGIEPCTTSIRPPS